MNVTFLASVLALALLQGALVALPRHGALMRLDGFGSAMWALALPGLIVIGTFGLVLVPSGAIDLVAFATFASPVLAMLAAVAVVRRHLVGAVALLIVGAGVVAVLQRGLVGNIAASLVTAFGAMLVGAAIVRLLPGRTLLAAIAMMCVADVVLMSFGIGQLSSHLIDEATHYFRGPSFDDANIGDVTTEYPDLLLAAVIGAIVAGRPSQRRTALLVVLCVGSYDLLMLVVPTVPATPPLLAALLLAQLHELPNLGALLRRPREASRSAFSAPNSDPVNSLSSSGLRAAASEPGAPHATRRPRCGAGARARARGIAAGVQPRQGRQPLRRSLTARAPTSRK